MEHKGTLRLESERLVLRKFTIEDAENAFQNWMSNDEVTKFLRWESHKNIDETKMILNSWIKDYEKDAFYQWAIEIKDLGEVIGTISVVDMDEKIDMVHIGYCIGSDWWSKGYTSEALALIIPFFFEKVKVNRLETQYDPNNIASGKVMEKCGMTYEATLREADWNNSGIVDACMYSILAKEYFQAYKN